MIKMLEDLLIEATCSPNVPGSIVAGLRKAVETATVRVKSSVAQTHQICVKSGGSHRVGDMVASAWPFISAGNWAPCDKDGWIQAGTAYATQPGLHFEFDQARNAWRPLPPKPSAIDEMAEQMKRWAAPTREDFDKAIDGLSDAMGVQKRRLLGQAQEATPALAVQEGGTHYKDMKIQPVEYIHANGLGYFEGNVVKYVSRWRAKGGLQDLKKARHYLDLLIELEGGTK